MLKKAVFLLVAVSIMLVGCLNRTTESEPRIDSNQNGNDLINTSPAETYQLKTLRDFSIYAQPIDIHDFHRLQILSWKFAMAVFTNDIDTMRAFMVPDVAFYQAWEIDIMNDLYYLILKGMQQWDDGVEVSYEFLIKGEDSTLHLTIFFTQTEDGWKVLWSGFES